MIMKYGELEEPIKERTNEIIDRSISVEENNGVNWRIRRKKENRRRSIMANSKKGRKQKNIYGKLKMKDRKRKLKIR